MTPSPIQVPRLRGGSTALSGAWPGAVSDGAVPCSSLSSAVSSPLFSPAETGPGEKPRGAWLVHVPRQDTADCSLAFALGLGLLAGRAQFCIGFVFSLPQPLQRSSV